jgi:hypothetical protein
MDESIAHPHDLISRKCRVALFGLSTYPASCLSNDLEILQDGEDEHAIMIEVGTGLRGSKLESLGRCVSHVPESDCVSFVHE